MGRARGSGWEGPTSQDQKGPLRKQGVIQKHTQEYQENRRYNNVYRQNEGEETKQRDGESRYCQG